VDKEGILSWPNPTAEKILLFTDDSKPNSNKPHPTTLNENIIPATQDHHNNHHHHQQEQQSLLDPNKLKQSLMDTSANRKISREVGVPRLRHGSGGGNSGHIETFNLTQHNNSNGYEVKFDDPNWTKSLGSLKPLVIKFRTYIDFFSFRFKWR
jgi:hypothetical protein